MLLSAMLADYLCLPANHSYVYNQTWQLPTSPGPYQVLSVVSDQPYASQLSYANNPVTGDLEETVMNNSRSVIQYELWSRNASSRQLRFKALAALHSTQCQQLCEANGFAVANVPLSFVDLSYVDGSARIDRYAITFAVLVATAFTKVTEYFDKYPKTNPPFLVNA